MFNTYLSYMNIFMIYLIRNLYVEFFFLRMQSVEYDNVLAIIS